MRSQRLLPCGPASVCLKHMVTQSPGVRSVLPCVPGRRRAPGGRPGTRCVEVLAREPHCDGCGAHRCCCWCVTRPGRAPGPVSLCRYGGAPGDPGTLLVTWGSRRTGSTLHRRRRARRRRHRRLARHRQGHRPGPGRCRLQGVPPPRSSAESPPADALPFSPRWSSTTPPAPPARRRSSLRLRLPAGRPLLWAAALARLVPCLACSRTLATALTPRCLAWPPSARGCDQAVHRDHGRLRQG